MFESKFPLGRIFKTIGVEDKAEKDPVFALYVFSSLEQHAAGRWGSVDSETEEANEKAVADKTRLSRIESRFTYEDSTEICISTGPEPSEDGHILATVIFFPSEN